MRINPINAMASLGDALTTIGNLSKNDKKRFLQCFTCKNINTCNLDEAAEDENGMCKCYNKMQVSTDTSEFADIFNKELNKEA
jgi:hypothetical protein